MSRVEFKGFFKTKKLFVFLLVFLLKKVLVFRSYFQKNELVCRIGRTAQSDKKKCSFSDALTQMFFVICWRSAPGKIWKSDKLEPSLSTSGSAKNSTLHTRSFGLLAIAASKSFGKICDNLDVNFFQLKYFKLTWLPAMAGMPRRSHSKTNCASMVWRGTTMMTVEPVLSNHHIWLFWSSTFWHKKTKE